MRLMRLTILAMSAALGPCAGLSAQTFVRPLEPVDQAVEDINPLSMSLRHMQFDLRQPAGFEQVYAVPGHPDLLMRANGGLFAVFPQSVYAQGKSGLVPLVPA